MKRLINFFLYRYPQKDYIKFSQARLTLNFCLITSFFSLLYVAIAYLIDFRASVLIMSVLWVLFLLLAFLIRLGISLKIISSIYLLLSYISAIILIYFSGMIYSSILPWLSFIPLAALVLQSKRTSFIWLGVCFFSIFGFALMQENVSNTEVRYSKEYEVWFFAGVYSGLAGIILVLSMIFQKAKDHVLKTVVQRNQLISSINFELKHKNDEILAQNEELQQQKEEIMAQREFIETKNRELLVVQDELNTLIEKLTITQNTLASREAEYKSVLDSIYNTQLLVGEFDLEGNTIKISPKALKFFQIEEEGIIGKPIDNIGKKVRLEIKNGPDFHGVIQEIIKGNSSNHEAVMYINGKEHWLKENYFAVLDNRGKPLKGMIISQDITQIKNQQREIEALNKDLKSKLSKIERQNIQLASQQKEIELINQELKLSNDEIKNINQSLEQRVEERTKNLEQKNKQLTEYAYINAHLLRGPLCSILGLVRLMEANKPEDSSSIVMHMKKSSQELQQVVDKITSAIEKGAHFDRNLIYKK